MSLFSKKQITSPRQLLDKDSILVRNYSNAIHYKDAYVVMLGDDGGQIYVTFPLTCSKLKEVDYAKATELIDILGWNDTRTSSYTFELAYPGKQLLAGMGGGLFADNLWIHPDLLEKKEYIKEVLKIN